MSLAPVVGKILCWACNMCTSCLSLCTMFNTLRRKNHLCMMSKRVKKTISIFFSFLDSSYSSFCHPISSSVPFCLFPFVLRTWFDALSVSIWNHSVLEIIKLIYCHIYEDLISTRL
ncbi:hypothetical protein ASPWEDRAFT_364437 [Aspergillus wentii DTO 134E9]|uniref:Uncharacterized protein n=1 Tax=Aspergillus wentii DTO 134E9 TaxID=1073089 RepID=A0A1L9RWG8_ASPWE|nr:uncharacterized protein ASPWEDRAFT_364437 [Aspergillus wentii DTO 134E9]OJJ39272.1 hypothetical protein ASPWEDRAFT_364437 [Aspergillus wentii DTO 134E9]